MIEIQCTSCHTRYRIDERVLPEDSPTFKCSRCGHVFTSNPVPLKSRAPAQPHGAAKVSPKFASPKATEPEPEAVESAASPPRPDFFAASKPLPAAEEEKASPLKPLIRRQPAVKFPAANVDIDEGAAARMKEEIDSGELAPPPAAAPSAPSGQPEDPFDRLIERPQIDDSDRDSDRGENLRFEFDDDQPELGHDDTEPAPNERWSVGDEPPETAAPAPRGFTRTDPSYDPSFGQQQFATAIAAPAMREELRPELPDDVAYLERGKLHSAGFFIGVCFAFAIVFVGISLAIASAPLASADLLRKLPVIGSNFDTATPLASMVNVANAQANYQTVKGGHPALVVSGVAKNASAVALQVVQIGVRLLDPSQHELAASAVYCGNNLSTKMIAEMTPHELDFLQKLDPQKSFVLQPAQTAPFLMVFIDPPRGVSHFAIAVSKAVPAQAQPAPTP